MSIESNLPGEIAFYLKLIVGHRDIPQTLDDVIKYLENFIEQCTDSKKKLLPAHALGKALFLTGHIDKIIDDYWNIQEMFIYRSASLLLKGLSRQTLELLDFDRKIKSLDRALQLELAGVTAFALSVTRKEKESFRIHDIALKIYNNSADLTVPYLWNLERYAYNLRARGMLESSANAYYSLLDRCLATNTVSFRILGYKGLGHIAEHENKPGKAVDLYNRALNISKQTGIIVFDPIILNRKGMAVISLLEEDSQYRAEKLFEKAIEKARELNAPWLELGPTANLAGQKMRNLDHSSLKEARDDYIFLRDFQREFQDKKDLYWILINLATIDALLGRKISCKKHLHEAEHVKTQYQTESVNITTKRGSLEYYD
ncbi:MAG: hypothetical protein ACTSP4_04660 [Candidatus Hodarchaeales archaeon]